MGHVVFVGVLPGLNILIGVGAVALNTVTGWFFRSRSGNVMHLIYYALSCSDFVAGAAALIQGSSLVVFSLSTASLGYTGPVFYTLGQVALHTSVVYSVVLTLYRSVTIRFRFYRLNRKVALTFLFFVPIFWSVVVMSELLLTNLFLYPPHVRRYGTRTHTVVLIKDLVVFPRPGGALVYSLLCRTGLASLASCASSSLEVFLVFINLILPYGLPIVVSLVSTIYQTYHIIFKRKSRVTRTNRRMTETIVILTVTFLVCNSAYFVTTLSTMRHKFTENIGIIQAINSSSLFYLNSFITPLVLCLRGTTLNKYVRNVVSTKGYTQGNQTRRCQKPTVVKITNVVKNKILMEKNSGDCLIETAI